MITMTSRCRRSPTPDRRIGAPILLLSALASSACTTSLRYQHFDDVPYDYPNERTFWGPHAGVNIHIAELGPLEGTDDSATPLLLLHPWSTNMLVWVDVARPLARNRRVILIDLPGHGKSGKLAGSYPIARLAAAVVDVLDQARIQRAVLAGNSIGGATAIETAIHFHARVSALILIDAPGGDRYPELMQRSVVSGMRPRAIATLADPLYYITQRVMVPNMPAIARRMYENSIALKGSTEYERYSEAASTSMDAVLRYTPEVESISAPTLVIQGSEDWMVPMEAAVKLARRIPGARLERIESCGHVPQMQCPKQLLPLMESFLVKTGSR
jgi:pimeloyl-ACP methyl ester carboxylesterase